MFETAEADRLAGALVTPRWMYGEGKWQTSAALETQTSNLRITSRASGLEGLYQS